MNLRFLKRKIENFNLILPASYRYFLYGYIKYGGFLGSNIRKKVNIDDILIKKENFVYSEEAQKHIVLSNKVFINSFNNNGKYKVPFLFGLSLKREDYLINIFVHFLKLTRYIYKKL